MAVNIGDTNFDRVAEDIEHIASVKTASVIEGDAPAVAAVAKKFQEGIFETVRSQLKKEAQIVKVAAMNEHRRH